ncbi:chromate transporter [Fastidiosipila sanguinis]|nr:chromate transporter [Fastidiosipila sanguinis]
MLWELFLKFLKIGLFSFGGGYGMISLIEEECVEKEKWITHEDLLNVTIIAESTPGSVAINCATFVGKKQANLPGAMIATLGVILPSFVIVFLISLFFEQFISIQWIQNAFRGIQVAVAVLIVDAGINMFRKLPRNLVILVVAILSLLAILISTFANWNLSTVNLMLFGAVLTTIILPIYDKYLLEKDANNVASATEHESEGE